MAGKQNTYRKKTRELFMRLVFQMMATGDWSEDAADLFLGDDSLWSGNPRAGEPVGALFDKAAGEKPDLPYIGAGLDALREHLHEIDDAIEGASEKWRISRMAGVDLAILRVAIAELRYLDTIDGRVSINEAVELAKKYGSAKSPAFVNGILGKVAAREEGL
ncbi:MAG: transcription antitermination factor NusB [Clostridiales Family XIII bacterium]|jgi:N utilization substance protein B|nr:transcription antitermination factor NusB [Clostridiales Family XIII bacterium]